MRNDIAIIGIGEHSVILLETIALLSDKWNLVGIVKLNNTDRPTSSLIPANIKIFEGITEAQKLLQKNPNLKFIFAPEPCVPAEMRRLYDALNLPDQLLATVIHPSATVSSSAKIAPGTVLLARSVVQSGANIGKNCIINTGALIEYGVKIGDFSHVASGVIIGAGVSIGENCFIGLGSRIRDKIDIGKRVTVGTGSVVVTDIPDNETVVGVPARRISYETSKIQINELCIPPSTTIYEALSVIGRFGSMIALVTDEKRKLLGVLTDGDVRRALINHNDLNCPVEKIMTRNFSFVKPDVSRAAALDKMKAMVIRQLPIIDDDGIVVGLHLLSELVGTCSLPNIAVIMAGGKGERLRPITEAIPKPMVKVAGRPILEHIIHHLAGANIREIYLSINYLGEMIEDYFKDGSAYGCKIKYLKEEKPLGTAGALSLLPEIPKEPIIVMNADIVTQIDVERLLHHHHQGKYKITIGVHDYRLRIPFGVLEMENDCVREIREKPEEHFIVNGGIYVIEPELLYRIPKNEKYLMTELITSCLENKERVGIYFIEGDWIDIGQHSQLAQARGLSA